jgi:hypothetical protein
MNEELGLDIFLQDEMELLLLRLHRNARHLLGTSLPHLIITLVTTLEVNSAVSKIEVVTGTPPREYSVEKLY